MDKIIVSIFGLLSIIFTYWFFFMKKINTVQAEGIINILVDGGYKPERISIPYGKTTKLVFERKDSSPCLEEVILANFKVRKFLPLNEKTVIEINPTKKGEFDFSCGMGMFHGKLIVK
ncbi:Cupredoxin family domain protein [Candidatus Roizmanbacteria bacterium]|nr:Cupredoxin family domain protein [Candidatus Roizmanbacteria bacterium]